MADWYYARNNQQRGPVSGSELRHMAAAGELQPNDLVWTAGMPAWVRAASTEFFSEPAGHRDAPSARRRSDYHADEPPAYSPRYYSSRQRGMSSGAKVGLTLGIVFGSLVLVGVIVLVLVLSLSGRGSNTVSFSLGPGQIWTDSVEFQSNADVVITVRSDVSHPQTDVDLFVLDGIRLIASDTRISKDCDVRFRAPATQRYRIEVHNLGPGSARCVITYNSSRRK